MQAMHPLGMSSQAPGALSPTHSKRSLQRSSGIDTETNGNDIEPDAELSSQTAQNESKAEVEAGEKGTVFEYAGSADATSLSRASQMNAAG